MSAKNVKKHVFDQLFYLKIQIINSLFLFLFKSQKNDLFNVLNIAYGFILAHPFTPYTCKNFFRRRNQCMFRLNCVIFCTNESDFKITFLLNLENEIEFPKNVKILQIIIKIFRNFLRDFTF